MNKPIFEISSEALQKLKCSQCQKYLSVFPITSYANGSSICGRCTTNPFAIPNETYENLAENLKFPCIYNSTGCLELLQPKYMRPHEELCPYRKYNCPTKEHTKCEWTGLCRDMYDHYEDKHPTFLLKLCKFELDFINQYKESYIMPFQGDLYHVERIMDTETKLFSCCVKPLYVTSVNLFDISFKLVFQNIHKTQEPFEMEKAICNTVTVNTENLQKTLNDPLTIIVDIEVIIKNETPTKSKKSANAVNTAVLKELECIVCMEYMVPPIMLCEGGHSICGGCLRQCVEKGLNCPMCKQKYTDNHNFALESLVTKLDYPCKYESCTFSSKATDIKAHEKHCMHGTFNCPLDDYVECAYQSVLGDIYKHLVEMHRENMLDMETVTLPFNATRTDTDSFIIKYFQHLFKLHYKYDAQQTRFYFGMQLVGPADQSRKIKYSIDINDLSGNNLRVYLKGQCSALCGQEEAFSENRAYLTLDLRQVQSLIKDNFSFSVRIHPDSMN